MADKLSYAAKWFDFDASLLLSCYRNSRARTRFFVFACRITKNKKEEMGGQEIHDLLSGYLRLCYPQDSAPEVADIS